MAPTTTLPVLIVGSGLGGLNLGHALRRRGIPYRIFERDAADSQRAQGYRISLDEGGTAGLRAALPDDIFAKLDVSYGEEKPVGGRLDGPSGKVLQSGLLGLLGTGGLGMFGDLARRVISKKWAGPWCKRAPCFDFGLAQMIDCVAVSGAPAGPKVPPGPGTSPKVDRRMLRSVLLTSQTDTITYDSAFSSYTVSPDSVTAHFTNGTEAKGALLVGADGTRSRVAVQLLGEVAAPLDLGLRLVYGKTPLAPDFLESLHPTLRHGASFVVDTSAGDARRLLLVVEPMRFWHPDSPEDYLFWALAADKETFLALGGDDEELLRCQGQQAAAIASKLTAKWHPSIRVIFEKQDVEQSATLRMSSSNPDGPPVWQTDRRVTLLGDAIHCMPPTGGQGANSALYDAALLGAALGDAEGEVDGGGWTVQTIRDYEDAMRYNIGDVVGLACIGASRIIRRRPFGT